MNNTPPAERVLRAFAVGDALGTITESRSREDALALLDAEVILSADTVSADTNQVLLVAEHLVNRSGTFDADSFVALVVEAGLETSVGPATAWAISTGSEPTAATSGAAIRAVALGLANSIVPPAEALHLLEEVQSMNAFSHNTLAAHIGATVIAVTISAGLDGFNLREAIDIGLKAGEIQATAEGKLFAHSRFALLGGNAWEQLSAAYTQLGPEAGLEFIEGNLGSSAEIEESAVSACAIALLHPEDPFEAALQGARLGGDSETIAALAAALVASCGPWNERIENAAGFVETLNGLEFKTIAERVVSLRGRLTGEIDV